jgi:hypothetical protein
MGVAQQICAVSRLTSGHSDLLPFKAVGCASLMQPDYFCGPLRIPVAPHYRTPI